MEGAERQTKRKSNGFIEQKVTQIPNVYGKSGTKKSTRN